MMSGVLRFPGGRDSYNSCQHATAKMEDIKSKGDSRAKMMRKIDQLEAELAALR